MSSLPHSRTTVCRWLRKNLGSSTSYSVCWNGTLGMTPPNHAHYQSVLVRLKEALTAGGLAAFAVHAYAMYACRKTTRRASLQTRRKIVTASDQCQRHARAMLESSILPEAGQNRQWANTDIE